MSQLLDARYRVVQLLGTNAVEESYLAEDTNSLDSVQYVIKKLKLPTTSEPIFNNTRRLFTTEAEKLQQISQSHNQIQKLVGYFEELKEFSLVQEYVLGNPLSEEIFIGKPINQNRVIDILLDVLEILASIHSRGVVHGNIKLTNIIRRESDRKLVLVDFRSARKQLIAILKYSNTCRWNNCTAIVKLIAIFML